LAWSAAAAGKTEALIEQGRTDDALAWSREALAAGERAELGPSALRDLVRALALAEACAGDHEQGASRLEQLIDEQRRHGLAGLCLGVLYEARARVALMAGQPSAFESFAQLTAAQYRPGANPALIAKYERLVETARTREFMLTSRVVNAALAPSDFDQTDPGEDAYTQLEQDTGGEDRAQRALRLLVEQTRAEGGLLYSVHEDGIRLVASSVVESPDAELESALQAYLQAELESSSEATVTCFDQPEESSGAASSFGRFRPFVLTRVEGDRSLVVGIAALLAPDERAGASERALSVVSDILSSTDDVVSIYAAG
jgi:ATP/maltotriose-dependent transcriptional regulator MalT